MTAPTITLAGKTALVTAAGQGIGHASVLALAAAGAEVWATDRDAALLERFAGTERVRTAALDVLDKARIAEVVRQIGRVDVLFNCTGIVHNGTVLEATDEQLDAAFALNVRAQLWMIQAVLPGMIAAGGGSIINMASVPRASAGCRAAASTGTTKAAVIGLTKAVAADAIKQGVRCNALCPGTVDTPSLADRINAYADPVAARQAFVERQPMGGWRRPKRSRRWSCTWPATRRSS